LAALACDEEVEIRPKPGLVDPEDTGCHEDMDRWTFHLSGVALAPLWGRQARIGLEGTPPEAALPLLRSPGCEMERTMFAATGGVNTHKGLIFALSLLLYGAGRALRFGRFLPEEILRNASEAVAGCTARELLRLRASPGTSPSRLSHGEGLFLRLGVSGIRGEAERGFPSLRGALGALDRARRGGAGRNEGALSALLLLMGTCEDTNVIHRGGIDFFLGIYRGETFRAYRSFDPARPGGYDPVRALDALLRSRRASPGGAADLLACTLFLDRCRDIVINDDIVYLYRQQS
jgi:triphosphoribosyl-dephospho-CoA synthetase